MQQLTIPFPEFCQVAGSENVTATKEQIKEAAQIEAAVSTAKSWLQQDSALCLLVAGEKVSRLTAIYGTAVVVSSIVLVTFAAIIGG